MNDDTIPGNAFDFDKTFLTLTGNSPFPWQQALYKRFSDREIPASCSLPTGLGKTSVVAIWLIALANFPSHVPRRLVYVANRRTVVDQTTNEVEGYRTALQSESLSAVSIARRKESWGSITSRPPIANAKSAANKFFCYPVTKGVIGADTIAFNK